MNGGGGILDGPTSISGSKFLVDIKSSTMGR